MNILLFYTLVLSSLAYGFDFDGGVYAPKINDGRNCSWFITYDSSSKKITIKSVNDIWNGFKCNEDTNFTLDCKETDTSLTCQDYLKEERRVKTKATARAPFTIIVEDPFDVSRDLGILKWRAEEAPIATRYYGKSYMGWKFPPQAKARCIFEPAGFEYCESLAVYQVQRNCEGLEKSAQMKALKNCHQDGHANCVLISSDVRLAFSERTNTTFVFTGCIGTATAEPK